MRAGLRNWEFNYHGLKGSLVVFLLCHYQLLALCMNPMSHPTVPSIATVPHGALHSNGVLHSNCTRTVPSIATAGRAMHSTVYIYHSSEEDITIVSSNRSDHITLCWHGKVHTWPTHPGEVIPRPLHLPVTASCRPHTMSCSSVLFIKSTLYSYGFINMLWSLRHQYGMSRYIVAGHCSVYS